MNICRQEHGDSAYLQSSTWVNPVRSGVRKLCIWSPYPESVLGLGIPDDFHNVMGTSVSKDMSVIKCS